MCVLSLMYSYVAVCTFYTVRCLSHNYFLLFVIAQLLDLCFNIFYACFFLFYIYVCFVYYVFVLLCLLFLFLCCRFPIVVQDYRPLPPGGNPIALHNHHHHHHHQLQQWLCVGSSKLLFAYIASLVSILLSSAQKIEVF